MSTNKSSDQTAAKDNQDTKDSQILFKTTLSDQGSLLIRFAQRADTPMIMSFIRQLAEYEKLLDKVVVSPQDLEHYLFIDKKAEVIMAIKEGVPVGFALFFHKFSTFLGKPGIYLEDLFVVSTCRGQGIGGILLSVLAQITVSRKYSRLEWAVLDWNKPAIDFYDGIGAEPLSDWITYRATDQALVDLAAKHSS